MDAVYLENCLKSIIIQLVNDELSITNTKTPSVRGGFCIV